MSRPVTGRDIVCDILEEWGSQPGRRGEQARRDLIAYDAPNIAAIAAQEARRRSDLYAFRVRARMGIVIEAPERFAMLDAATT